MGLMTGTSMDGLDISIIQSDGHYQFYNILDKYFDYDINLQGDLISLRNKIFNQSDLTKYTKELINLERKITIFHADKINYVLSKYKGEI